MDLYVFVITVLLICYKMKHNDKITWLQAFSPLLIYYGLVLFILFFAFVLLH